MNPKKLIEVIMYQISQNRFSPFKLKALILGVSLAFAASMPSTLLAETTPSSGEMSQNFQDVDISKVIEAVAKISGRNFIIDPRVKGKVTLIAPEAMEPDALYETLLAVLDVHGFVAIPNDNVIKVVPANLAKDKIPYRQARDNGEEWVTEVLNVNNVEATKLVAILRPMVAREGHLVGLADSNKLIVTDMVSNIQRIKSVLARVDKDLNSEFEVLQVEHAPAKEIEKTLKALLPRKNNGSGVSYSVDERSNRIVLSGDPQKRIQIRALIAELDIPVNANGQLKVVYLRYAKAAELLPVLQKISENTALLSMQSDNSSNSKSLPAGQKSATNPLTASDKKTSASAANSENANAEQPPAQSDLDQKTLKNQIRIEADERMNALVISAPQAVTQNLLEVIKQLDVRRAQVLIEAVFVEISEDRVGNLGIEWAALGDTGAGIVSFSGALPAIAANLSDPATAVSALTTGINIGVGDINSNNHGWAGLLQALRKDTASNILATPSILTLDNEEAEILVGREVPFSTGSYTSTTNSVTNPFTTIERQSVGLKLKVKPQINEGDEIYLDIDQEVSDVLDKGEAVDLQTSKRQIKTRVIVGDGNVVVLGGLINEKETEVESKVPGLGDIPGLGRLFRSTENSREKVNLMVFLRPIIVRDNAMSNYYSQQKYTYMFEQQQRILNTPLKDREPSLKPELPTLPQFQQHGATLLHTPKTVEVEIKQTTEAKANMSPAEKSLQAFEEITGSDF